MYIGTEADMIKVISMNDIIRKGYSGKLNILKEMPPFIKFVLKYIRVLGQQVVQETNIHRYSIAFLCVQNLPVCRPNECRNYRSQIMRW